MHKFRPGDKNSRGTAGAFYERFFPPANLKMRTKTKKKNLYLQRGQANGCGFMAMN